MKTWLLLLAAIAAEVTATTALKASHGFTRLLPSLVVVAGYGLAFWLLALTLRVLPVGVAYAIWSGLGTALIVLLAWLIYGQTMDAWGLLGLALIVAGVLVLNLLSRSAAH